MLLGAGGLVVETPSPDALCPPLEPTREFVRARLGELDLEGTWRASYVLVHRAHGDFIALTLRDPQGTLRLERELPAQGNSCATLGQVIALVLERFFMRPEAEPVPASSTQEAPPEEVESESFSEPAQRAPLPVADAAPTMRSTAAAESVTPTRALLGAGLNVTTAWVGPSLGGGFERGAYRLEARLGFDLRDHEDRQGSGWLRLRRVPIAVSLAREVTSGNQLATSLALEFVGLYEHAAVSGLPVSSSSSRIVPGLGARFALDFPLARARPRPFLDVNALLLLGAAGRRFLVDSREVAEPPTWVLGVGFGIRTLL
ncbi:MAG: hypothetical protein ACOY0T_29050 [Myxococcota bacterium]